MGNELKEYVLTFNKVDSVNKDTPDLGLRSKLGGKPDWDQYDETPDCPSCKNKMTFISQLDSIEHWSNTNPHSINPLKSSQEYMFGDVGMIYTFFCFECCEVKSVFQCG